MPARLFTALLLLGLGLGAGCGPPAPAPRPPVVLITAGALRADAVGRDASWTARLDEFAADADWSGTAVTASSEPPVSLASLLTGASPWQHQLLSAGRTLRSGLPTLAQGLARRGYRTRAYVPSFLHGSLGAGFREVAEPLSGPAAARLASALADGDFVWLHFAEAELARGRRRRAAGDRRLARHRLLAFADPGADLPPGERDALWRVYGRKVRILDGVLGEVVDALRRGAAWDRALVVVTGSHGLELGEHGQILHGENLGRASIEVPLWVRLPRGCAGLAEPAGARVAQARLAATVAEVTALAVTPVQAPSLFRVSAAPVLSELYRGNGRNRFSLLDGDLQLHWAASFAPPEPAYYQALRAVAGGSSSRLEEPPRRLFDRLDRAFLKAPPLAGLAGTAPRLSLERWTQGGVEPVDDPAAARALAVELRRRWSRFVDRERPPGEERSLPFRGLTSPASGE